MAHCKHISQSRLLQLWYYVLLMTQRCVWCSLVPVGTENLSCAL